MSTGKKHFLVALLIAFVSLSESYAIAPPTPLRQSEAQDGVRLKRLRTLLGMTQDEFGQQLGEELKIPSFPKERLSEMENGKIPVSPTQQMASKKIYRAHAGERLRFLRECLGLSPKEWGELLRPEKPFSSITLGNLENGRTSVREEILEKAMQLYQERGASHLESILLALEISEETLGEWLRPKNPISHTAINLWKNRKFPIREEILFKVTTLYREKSRLGFKIIREALDLSQKEFGQELDPENLIPQTTMVHYEKGDILIPQELFKNAKKIFREKIGLRFKTIREALGLSQRELGRKLRPSNPIHYAMMSALEVGKAPFTETVILSLLEKAKRIYRKQAGKILKSYREVLGFSHDRLGSLLRPENPYPSPTVVLWENGTNFIAPEILNRTREIYQEKAGAHLKSLRKAMHLSGKRLGQELNPKNPIPEETIYSWENSNPPPSHNTLQQVVRLASIRLKKIREALELDPSEFGKLIRPKHPASEERIDQWENGLVAPPEKILDNAYKLYRKLSGDQLKSIRILLGLSQQAFGQRLNPKKPFSASRVAQWERGRHFAPEILLKATRLLEEETRLLEEQTAATTPLLEAI